MKTKFVMYSGLYTIGGVICSVQYGKDRVIFEMGSSYDPKTDVYNGTVLPRSKAWVKDAIRLEKIPAIPGIYRKQDIDGFNNLIPAEESDLNTAIFITHLHLDHMAGIGMVSPDIPIYMNENATIIERALEEVGEGVPTLERNYIHFDENQTINVGEIQVLPVLTGRRSYKHFAFLITTPDGTIHWTGDFSMHGEDVDLAINEMEFLQTVNVDVLLCDTTSFMDDVLLQMFDSSDPDDILPSKEIPPGMLDSKDVDRELFSVLEKQKGLCVFNFYQREMDEAKKYIEWAKNVDRTCVFEPDCAFIIYKFFNISPNVFIPDSDRYPEDPGLQPDWFKELLEISNVIAKEDIQKHPSRYLLQNSYRHILELFDLPDEDGAYLHADGIPIGEFDPAYQNLKRIIERTNFRYVTFFCENYFGHGYPPQVKYFVDQVDPKVLIPCHGFNPERLLPNNGLQLLPIQGETYLLHEGKLILESDYEQ
ncbi:MAG: MBL fold metallo-hydrolase [Candidatus Helarchaeota archaeon]